MIRVISGKHKGKKLKRVPGTTVRPMTQKLKESLFSILQERLADSIVLDGFAGTGSIGLEALSRGAQVAVFVDDFYPAVKVIKDNILKCGAEEKARVMHKEFNRAVIQLAKEDAQFDLIFLDPPYRLLDERDPLKVVFKRGVLKKNGLIVLRCFYKTEYKSAYFDLDRQVLLGDDRLFLFKRRAP
jgi:16S rRNA (guanine(966)-N(2))-methyltransferase RsmD